MKFFASALVAAILSATSASAVTVTMDFAGSGGFTPGLPGLGPFSGTIVYDTDNATQVGTSPLFNGAFSSIDITFNETSSPYSVTSGSSPTVNTFNQVELPGGGDAFLSNFAGSFGPTGTSLADPVNVFLELRMDENTFFSDVTNIFELVRDGTTFSLPDINFISLVVQYDAAFSDSSIYRLGTFTSFNITGSGPSPVPLPASLSLMLAGLGAMALAARRRRNASRKGYAGPTVAA